MDVLTDAKFRWQLLQWRFAMPTVPIKAAWSQRATRSPLTPVPRFYSLDECASFMAGFRYRFDPPGKDSINHPQLTVSRIADGPAQGDEDCDGASALWCALLLKAGIASEVYYAALAWRDKKTGAFVGHGSCDFVIDGREMNASNWNNGQPMLDSALDYYSAKRDVRAVNRWRVSLNEATDDVVFGKRKVLR